MNMNDRRAWQLVESMNQCFQSAMVETQTGGTHGGGAVIPELGQVILKKFRAIEQQAAKALEHNFQELSSYLKSPK